MSRAPSVREGELVADGRQRNSEYTNLGHIDTALFRSAFAKFAAGFLVSYALYVEIMRENAYLSQTVGVQEVQRVVDTGLYGVVRHPMYSATVCLFLSMPVVLGSLSSFVIMLVYLPIIAKRIRNEEAVLSRDLEGYPEYLERVRWRLFPHVW